MPLLDGFREKSWQKFDNNQNVDHEAKRGMGKCGTLTLRVLFIVSCYTLNQANTFENKLMILSTFIKRSN